MPASLNNAISRMQNLTNKSLSGLMSADKSQAANYVAATGASAILNILPSSLIYHTLVGNLPSFQNQPGLQALWEILQNTNLGLPNPATASTNNIISALNGLVPGTGAGGSSSTPTTTG